MLNTSFFKTTQKLNENPDFWSLKQSLFNEFKKTSSQNSKPEEVFQKSLRKADFEKKLVSLIKEISNSNKNCISMGFLDDPNPNLNEYKRKWLDFLNSQYSYLIQSYYTLSSESKDETIFFYDEQTVLNFLSKIQNYPNSIKPTQIENRLIKLEYSVGNIEELWQKYSCFENHDEEKEKYIERILERNVLNLYFILYFNYF